MDKFKKILKKYNISEDNVVRYGNDILKIDYRKISSNRKGKLVLVTAMSPTIYGEGKTCTTIGIINGLGKLGYKVMGTLREPSMGPVFGQKGGATGGGLAYVTPSTQINLNFTGDFSAIESANNLLCAAIDNHIYQGNVLKIKKILFRRCLDVNDRALRHVTINGEDCEFTITAASEIMAIFCLAENLDDLRKKLDNIIIGIDEKDNYIKAKELNVTGAMVALLKDALNPNMVLTNENVPCLIHGGPFANIAHGCNSVIATKTALNLADYVVTEAGFGADLGAEKFYDIKCKMANIKPDATVLIATIKALKHHGGVQTKDIYDKNNDALIKGLDNLKKHLDNLKLYSNNIIISLNKYDTDLDDEIKLVEEFAKKENVEFSINSSYLDGSIGSIDISKKLINILDNDNNYKPLYDCNLSIKEKIEIISKKIYGAKTINYTDEADNKIKQIEKLAINYPICIAKTQYSLSDDPKKLGAPKDYEITVKDVVLYNGAGFITILLGSIVQMPGLPKKPNYENIDVIDDEIINVK